MQLHIRRPRDRPLLLLLLPQGYCWPGSLLQSCCCASKSRAVDSRW
jgi:hypothetical protein